MRDYSNDYTKGKVDFRVTMTKGDDFGMKLLFYLRWQRGRAFNAPSSTSKRGVNANQSASNKQLVMLPKNFKNLSSKFYSQVNAQGRRRSLLFLKHPFLWFMVLLQQDELPRGHIKSVGVLCTPCACFTLTQKNTHTHARRHAAQLNTVL